MTSIEHQRLRSEASAVDGRKLVNVMMLDWLLLLIVPLAAAGFGYLLAARHADVFEAEASIVLQPTAAEVLLGQDSRSSQDAERELETEAALLDGPLIEGLVDAEIGTEVSYRAERDSGTDIITVVASAATPAAAAEAADGIVAIYLREREVQEKAELDAAADALDVPAQQLEAKLLAIDAAIDAAGGPELSDRALLSEESAVANELAVTRASIEELRVESAVTTGGARQVAEAIAPSTAISPKPARSAVIWFVLGLVGAIVIAWLREQFDDGLLSVPASTDMASFDIGPASDADSAAAR